MNWQIVFQGLSVLVAMTTLGLTVVKFANRKTAALEQAQNSLALLKALREQTAVETDPVKLRTSEGLQGKLLERSMYATQLYVKRTDPVMVSYAQVVLIGLGTLVYYIYFMSNPIAGIPRDVFDIAAAVFLITGAAVTWWATTLVMGYRENTGQLRKGLLILPAEKRRQLSWRKFRRDIAARSRRWLVKGQR